MQRRRGLRYRAARLHAVQHRPVQNVGHAPVVAVTDQGDASPVVQDQLRAAGLRLETQRPLQARTLRRIRIQAGFVACRQTGVGGRHDAQSLRDQSWHACDGWKIFRAWCQCGFSGVTLRPGDHGGHGQCADDPGQRDTRFRPGGAKIRRSSLLQPLVQARALEPLQRIQVAAIGEQQVRAVFHVRAPVVELPDQPAVVQRARSPRCDGEQCGDAGQHRQRGGGHALPTPGDGREQQRKRQSHRHAVRDDADTCGLRQPGEARARVHGDIPRRRRVAISRSNNHSAPISRASHGRRSRGACAYGVPPVSGA